MWRVEYMSGHYVVFDENCRFVVDTYNRRVAHLIAAAPALLAACEALPLDCEFTDAADFKDNARRFPHAMGLARTAVRKAKGES